MSAQQADIDLGPLYEPAPVAFSFNEPGWYILFAIACTMIAFGLYKRVKHYLHNAYRRQAVVLINGIEDQFKTNKEAACVNDVMVVLKQVAITTYSREVVGSLNGEAWLNFLDQKAKTSKFKSFAKLITDALYKDKLTKSEQFSAFATNAKKWIHEHS